MLRNIAPSTDIANGRLSHADINPLRPHALRASFSDQMAKAGASKQFIDYLMGHKLAYDTAYFGGEEGLREAYVKYAEQALEPKGLAPEFEKLYEEQKATISTLTRMLNEQVKATGEVKQVLTAMIKAPLGAMPNVRPPVDVKKLSNEDFEKYMKAESEKYEKEWEEAERIVEGWSKPKKRTTP